MTYEKAICSNPTVRKHGTPNKATTAARAVISAALAGTDAAILQAKLAALDGKDFIDAYVKVEPPSLYPQPSRHAVLLLCAIA